MKLSIIIIFLTFSYLALGMGSEPHSGRGGSAEPPGLSASEMACKNKQKGDSCTWSGYNEQCGGGIDTPRFCVKTQCFTSEGTCQSDRRTSDRLYCKEAKLHEIPCD